jgi:hypothetical protein
LGLAAPDRGILLRGRAFILGLMGVDIEPTVAEYLSISSPENSQVGMYLFAAAMGSGDYAAAARRGEEANNERPEIGVAGPAVWAAVMDRDLDNAKRLLQWMDRAPIIGRLDIAQRVIARAAVAALEGNVAEAMPSVRAGMAELTELGDAYHYGAAALAIIRAVGPGIPEVREYATRALAIFEGMQSEGLAAQVRRELAAESPTAKRPQPSPTTEAAPTPAG